MFKRVLAAVCVAITLLASVVSISCGEPKDQSSTVKMEGSSMLPTYHSGEVLETEDNPSDIARGDVVVFNPPFSADYSLMLKRVVGLPGDVVEIKEGHVFINGSLLNEDPDFGSGARVVSVTVPDDNFFVLGDNRGSSKDSSEGWTVPRENITKKVVETEGAYHCWIG